MARVFSVRTAARRRGPRWAPGCSLVGGCRGVRFCRCELLAGRGVPPERELAGAARDEDKAGLELHPRRPREGAAPVRADRRLAHTAPGITGLGGSQEVSHKPTQLGRGGCSERCLPNPAAPLTRKLPDKPLQTNVRPRATASTRAGRKTGPSATQSGGLLPCCTIRTHMDHGVKDGRASTEPKHAGLLPQLAGGWVLNDKRNPRLHTRPRNPHRGPTCVAADDRGAPEVWIACHTPT